MSVDVLAARWCHAAARLVTRSDVSCAVLTSEVSRSAVVQSVHRARASAPEREMHVRDGLRVAVLLWVQFHAERGPWRERLREK